MLKLYYSVLTVLIFASLVLAAKKRTTAPPTVIESYSQINTISLPSWSNNGALLPINNGCTAFPNPDGTCSGYNLLTLKQCSQITYFNQPVCGGLSCFYNSTKGQCDGQCSNSFLGKCVSIVSNPSSNADCKCATSNSYMNGTSYDQSQNVLTIEIPWCDASTCFGNSCSFFFVSVNRVSDNQLYGWCNNDQVNQNQTITS